MTDARSPVAHAVAEALFPAFPAHSARVPWAPTADLRSPRRRRRLRYLRAIDAAKSKREDSRPRNRTKYVYNALGQRIQKSGGPAGTVLTVYDESGHLEGEYDGSGNLIQETVWLGDTPVATIRPNGSGVAVYYVHSDHLNAPRMVTRPSDNAIAWRWDTDPFGTAAPNQNPQGLGTFVYNLRYPGQYYDSETGLNYNYFRDYDPQTGRYTESDPAGLKSGVNTYAYVTGIPTGYADPLGLWGTDAHNLILQRMFPWLTWGQLQAVERGSAEVDNPLNQGPSTAYEHAMRAPGQSVDDARKKMCAFVNANMATYSASVGSSNVVDQYNAYVALGRALHPIMDSTSPAHSGWQVWDNPALHPGEMIPHGNAMGSIEGVDALTPSLMQETLRRIRDAMAGQGICGCDGK